MKKLFTCVLLFSTSLVHAGGFQLNEHGSRAMAQGGAFAARAYDASAIYFNPAGLGFQTRGAVYVGTTLIVPQSTFYGPTNLNLGTKNEMVSQLFTPINVYATYPVNEQIHVGIGINNPYGLGTEWPDNWSGKFITQKVNLESFFFSPTVAFKVNDQFSLGAGFNYVTGDVSINRYVSDPFDPHGKIDLELSGSGMGFNLGAIYKISEKLSAGVSYRSSVKIDAEGTATFTPVRPIYPAGDATASIELPATAFLGIAYTVIDNLELEADYQYIGWSSYKELAISFAKDGSKTVSPKNYEDTFILRFGGEYTMEDIQLRFGYLYDNNPVQDRYAEPLLPDADRHGINLGAGYKISEQLSVDVAYLFLQFNERSVSGTEVHFDGVYQASAHLLGINFGYSF